MVKESQEKEAKSVFETTKQGPQRRYIPYDLYIAKGVGSATPLDILLAIAIITGFPWYIMKLNSGWSSQFLNESELNLLRLIDNYKNHKFILSFNGAFGIQLLSHFSATISLLRTLSLCLGACTLSLVYLTLRRTNVNYLISMICTLSIGYIPLFQTHSTQISLDVVVWFLLSLICFIWTSSKIQDINAFGINLAHSIFLSITVGLIMSTKYLGAITWLWIIVVSVIQFWYLIGDAELSTKQIMKISISKFVPIVTLPFLVFTITEYNQMVNWTVDTQSYSQYMTPYFQSYLRGQREVPTELYYGATIRLRHTNSLGGYLTSHNASYPGGSSEQLVTVSDKEDTVWNLWVIEASDNNRLYEAINERHDVKLRHKKTGKLLRASSAKPPISEQEYDREVSCTGDVEYQGDRDEHWRIDTIKLYDDIKPARTEVQLHNAGQDCYLISHDQKLPVSWGFGEQEVVCLAPPTVKFSKFIIEIVEISPIVITNFEQFGFDSKSLSVFECDFWKLLWDLLKTQYKFDYFKENFKKEGVKVSKWPFIIDGNALAVNCWLSSILAIVIFCCWKLVQAIKINPWPTVDKNVSTEPSLNSIVVSDVSIELVLGWFLHYYIFNYSPHENLDVTLYFPSYIFGELLFAQFMNVLYQWKHMSFPIIVAYLSFIVYKL